MKTAGAIARRRAIRSRPPARFKAPPRKTLYPLWRQAPTKLGCQIQELQLIASDFGVPQRRTRLFVVATRGRAPNLELTPTPEPALFDWAAGRSMAARRQNHPGVGLTEPIRTITTKDQWISVDDDRYRPLTLREYAAGMGFPADYAWPADVGRVDAIRGLGTRCVRPWPPRC